MIAGLRKYAYSISALAIACFFLVPFPNVAVIGALFLQTLAFIVIAGKSAADGIVLTGVSCLLIGSLSADHPMIREVFFSEIRPWILVAGAVITVAGIMLVIIQLYNES